MARATGVAIETDGIYSFLRAAARVDKQFNVEMRQAGQKVADGLADRVAGNAHGPYGKVWLAMRAKRDRIPTIELQKSRVFSRRRKGHGGRATMADVFFGAEHGGRGRPTTQQFPPHRGRQGYVFWPTVRADQHRIADQYLDALERVIRDLSTGS